MWRTIFEFIVSELIYLLCHVVNWVVAEEVFNWFFWTSEQDCAYTSSFSSVSWSIHWLLPQWQVSFGVWFLLWCNCKFHLFDLLLSPFKCQKECVRGITVDKLCSSSSCCHVRWLYSATSASICASAVSRLCPSRCWAIWRLSVCSLLVGCCLIHNWLSRT